MIQDIISRPGWIAGNAISIIVDGDSDGHRTAESYNGVPSSAPELHIESAIGGFNTQPTVTLAMPDDDDIFQHGVPIIFEATASDREDGDLDKAIQWTSSLNGPIGTGGNLILNDLFPGKHTITARVEDRGGVECIPGNNPYDS